MEHILSVIIPSYNRVSIIQRAVASVLVQQLPAGWNTEIIVVDDGSDDGTTAFVEQTYSAQYGKSVQVMRLPHCGMPGAVRNAGILQAQGMLLAFLDSDDEWLPGKLKRQIPLHCDSDGNVIDNRLSHTKERWMRNGREIRQPFTAQNEHIFLRSLRKCVIGPSTVMMSRTMFEQTGGFRNDLEIAEDYEFWLRLTAQYTAMYIDTPLTVKHAGHGDQLSEKYGHIEYFRLCALRQLLEQGFFTNVVIRDVRKHDTGAEKIDGDRAARNELARKCAIYAAGARKRGRCQEAEEYANYGRALRND